MIRPALHRLKRTMVASFRSVVPPKRRNIADDASLSVPFARASLPRPAPGLRIAVMCHLFHTDLCGLILETVSQIPQSFDMLISTDTEHKRRLISEAFAPYRGGTVTVRVVENRGRDIAPKLITFADSYADYDLVLFLHTKKSQHYQYGDAWRDGLLRSLCGSPETVGSILHIFESRPDIGMVIGQHFLPIREWIFWNGNFTAAWKLARRMGLSLPINSAIDFPSGSMFWARPQALRPLLGLGLAFSDFPPERGQINKTVHHALERLLLFACEHAGFGWVKVSSPDAQTGPSPRHRVERDGDLAKFIETRSWSLLARPPRGRRAAHRSRAMDRADA